MKTNLKQTIIATLIIIGMAGVVGAVVTTSADFPHRLSSFQDNDIINAGDFNNIEAEIGTRIGNVATGTPQTLNWIVRNASFASTTLTVGLTASTTISGDTGTSTFVNGITLNAGCFRVAGSCLISASGTINSGTTNRFTYYSGATALSSANGFIIDTSNGSTTFPTLNVGTLTATTGTSFLNTLSLGSALTVANGGTGATTLTGAVVGNGTSAFTAGTLTVGNGGTGQTSFTAGRLLYGSATDGLQVVATSSASCAGSVSCSSFTVVGGVSPTITGNPNLTINTIGTTKYIGASTTALAWSMPSGFVSNSSSTIVTLVTNTYKSFTVASTTLLTGTTTIPLGTTIVKETWQQVVCRTDTGTADVIFYNSGNPINAGTGITRISASTASSSVTFTAGNSLPALTNRKADIGNLGSSPNYITCSLEILSNQ